VDYSDGSWTTFTWDAGNRLTQVSDSLSGTVARTYDVLNRLTQEVSPQGTITYGYDDAGRRTAMTVQGQSSISYAYDEMNRLVSIVQGTAAVTLGYDDACRLTSLTFPNGSQATYSYDAASRLTNATFVNGPTTLGTLTYAYDAAGRLTSTGGTWARIGLPQAVGSATYNQANQQLSWGSQSLSYDLNGNLSLDGTNTFSWDARNRLTAVSGPGLAAAFQYDAFGRRIGRTINGQTTAYLYDRFNSVQELQASVVVANVLTGLQVDQFFTRTDSSGRRMLLADALATVLALADDGGTVQTQYTYEPFGGTTVTGQASNNPVQYTGRENDGTGLYYYRARYYHPALQRFISEDPLRRDSGDANFYAYVGNAPVNASDPSGLQWRTLPGDPTPKSGDRPTIVCNGRGGIGIYVGDTFDDIDKACGIVDCAVAHEQIHAQEAAGDRPCKGKADGTMIGTDSATVRNAEIRAIPVELSCLRDKLAAAQSSGDVVCGERLAKRIRATHKYLDRCQGGGPCP
jgi:RHS repeat-associated protein